MRQLATYRKQEVPKTGVVSGGETQEEITRNMDRMILWFKELFRGVGRARQGGPHPHLDGFYHQTNTTEAEEG